MSNQNFDNFIVQYPIRLNEQQKEAAQVIDGYTLLLAVPGSGKTTVLITRLGYMVLGLGIKPENILTVTFTKAAANDMKARYRKFFGVEVPAKMRIGTINSFCYYILRAAEDYGFPHYETVSDGQSLKLISDICKKINGIDFTKNNDNEVKKIAQAITLAKNMLTPDEEISAEKIEHFADIYSEYNRSLHENGLIDFDDQLVFAYNILNNYPEILERIQRRYRYVCVDEAQDTSKVQHRIIDLIAKGSGNLFMVGDEDQCIYAFRGGYPDALMDFRKTHSGARVMKIEYNYRSAPEITSAAQRFIEQNRYRDASKKIRPARKDGRGVTEIFVQDEYRQLMTIIEAAKDCTVDTAVLYRNNDSAIAMIDRLCALGIPFKCRELNTMFFSGQTVRDVRDIISFSEEPENKRLFLSLYYKIGTFLRKEEAEAIVRTCGKDEEPLKFAESFKLLASFKREKCAELRRTLAELADQSAYEAMEHILEELNYRAYAEGKDYNPEHLRVLSLVSHSQPDLRSLVRRLDELEKIIRDDPSEPRCNFTLSTIHSSKGLEYKRVYLADVIDGCLPMANAKIEEERRLFYVGMTRAEDELYIFTFGREKLTSQFAHFVFPKGEYAKRRGAVRNLAGRKLTIMPPKVQTEESDYSGDYPPGTKVNHTIFGTGVVEKVNGDAMTIYFSKFGYKVVSVAVCEKNKWIKKMK